MVADGYEGYDEGEEPGEYEYIDSDVDSVVEPFEPPIHDEVSHGSCDRTGDRYEDDEFLRDQQNYLSDRGTHDFPNTDLLGALLSGEGGKAQQAQNMEAEIRRLNRDLELLDS